MRRSPVFQLRDVRRFGAIVAFLAATLACAAAPQPLTFTPGRADPAPCQRDCAEFIVAHGEIGPDSLADYAALQARLQRPDLPLILSSPGGRLDSALALGRALRRLAVPVLVAQPRPLGPGADGIMRYAPDFAPGTCNSACVYTFAGGVRRSLSPGSTLGVHQFFMARSDDAARRPKDRYTGAEFSNVQRSLAELATYLAEMQIDPRLLMLAADVAPSRIRTLSEGEAISLNLTTGARVALPEPARAAPQLRPAIAALPAPQAQRAAPAPGGPVVLRDGRPWLVLTAESQSRRFGPIANEVAIGCGRDGPGFIATFREILPAGRAASAGEARFAAGSGGGLLASAPGADRLRGTLSREAALAAARSGTLELDVVTAATAHHPMRVAFPGDGLGDGLRQLERACDTSPQTR